MKPTSLPPLYLIQILLLLWLHDEVSTLEGTPCYKQRADIAFLLDSSVSIHDVDFTKELQFVKHVLQPLPVGKSGVQVSVSTFGSDTVTNIYLDDFHNKENLMSAIDKIKYRGGQTKTDIAIAHARDVIFKKENGGDRNGVERIIIVVTDGYSTNNISTLQEAKKCRDLGIKMISVGVGHGIDELELRNIASTYNGQEMMFTVEDFDGLDDIVDRVAVAACDVMLQDSTIDTYCGGKPADVYIAVDSSSSVLDTDYGRFLSTLVNMFDIGPDTTRVGAIAYSDHVHPILRLDTSFDKSIIKERIMDIPIFGGKTKTGSALHYLRRNAFKQDYSRRNVAHVVILITDGKSSDSERVLREADLLRKLGVYIFVLGIGAHVDTNELRSIASRPHEKFVFVKKEATMLSEIRNLLDLKICTETSPSRTPDTQLDVDQGNDLCTGSESRYAMFVYDELSFSTKSENVIRDFVDKSLSQRTSNNLKYDWKTRPRDENRKYSQNEALASLLKEIRIYGLEQNVRQKQTTLLMFIENSALSHFHKMIVELSRLNYVHKPNVVLIYIGEDNKELSANYRRRYGLNTAHVLNVASVNELHEIQHTLIDQICSR